jgi:hypothetical protein
VESEERQMKQCGIKYKNIVDRENLPSLVPHDYLLKEQSAFLYQI